MADAAPRLQTGGCQCGAVRFRVEGALGDASVCHCRMCQKASGGFYMPLVWVRGAKLTWTRSTPGKFQSSNVVSRGFCKSCGTPLTYEAPDGIALSIGAFDHPEGIVPTMQWGIEAKLPYIDDVPKLPGKTTLEDPSTGDFLHHLVSYQHPDHDTETWPPEGRK
jgi:hypothetical protein